MTHSTANIKHINTIDNELDMMIIDFITNNITSLVRNQKYYAEELIGSNAWQTLDISMRIGIGKAVFRLVPSESLPLTYAGKHSNNKHQYWLT